MLSWAEPYLDLGKWEDPHDSWRFCLKTICVKSIKWRAQALRKSIFLHQYAVAWIENLRAGEGLTNGLPKQKWGENGRPWTLRQIDITSPTVEQMSAIPCFEAHLQTFYPHTYNTQLLAHLFYVWSCHFWSPTPPPLKISCTVLRVVTGETTRGIPKMFCYLPKVLSSWDHGLKWLSTFVT